MLDLGLFTISLEGIFFLLVLAGAKIEKKHPQNLFSIIPDQALNQEVHLIQLFEMLPAVVFRNVTSIEAWWSSSCVCVGQGSN